MKTIITTAALALLSTTALRAETFIVRGDAGYMNMRNGPGIGHDIVGTVPNGVTVNTSQCAPRDDHPGPDWCLVRYGSTVGWVSTGGLTSLQAPAQPRSFALTCAAPRLQGGGYDPDPVVSVDITRTEGRWSVQHTTVNGNVYNREQQYALFDQPTNNGAQWAGSRVKNGVQYYMIGAVRWAQREGRWAYGETLYANNRLDMQSAALCTEVNGVRPLPPAVPPPVATPVPAQPPSMPSTNVATPVQQNGPIVVTPTPNINIRIENGANPRVKAEGE